MSTNPVLARVNEELKKFIALKRVLRAAFSIEDWDAYGFTLAAKGTPLKGKVDLLITALVHGDEVGGLEAVNAFLSRFAEGKQRASIRFGFILCNVEAAYKGKRFLDIDLNRSFLTPPSDDRENVRARAIEKLVERAVNIIDLHQTVEPTEKPFFVATEDVGLVKWARSLDVDMPIVTFPPMGFSHSGKTILEFAASHKIRGLTVELGARGFSRDMATRAERLLWIAADKIAFPAPEDKSVKPEPIETFHLSAHIKNKDQAQLKSGLVNFAPVEKDEVVGEDAAGPVRSPCTGRIFFPKYGALAATSPELCEIGVPKKVGP